MLNLTVSEALKNAEHLKALGETTIYLYRDTADEFPYDKVTRVESGGSVRLSGPASASMFAEVDGLTFKLSVDFEKPDANGRGVSLFDRDRLRELFNKLPPVARNSFADLLQNECLPAMAKRTNDIREALREQADSEDCVRGLIAFARETEAA